MEITRQPASKTTLDLSKTKTYTEVVSYLDAHWSVQRETKTLDIVKKIEQAMWFESKRQIINISQRKENVFSLSANLNCDSILPSYLS